jgi:hypothetical protein
MKGYSVFSPGARLRVEKDSATSPVMSIDCSLQARSRGGFSGNGTAAMVKYLSPAAAQRTPPTKLCGSLTSASTVERLALSPTWQTISARFAEA